ncbi:MAG: N-acetylmuramoyl-L-alanine amidase [Candidatus Lambdaproteobacteria bacterium]|nr:N-acetylmuramoyl-L-alanine amidase [Candidatus Lambdaproteobacteria bacterium]
MIGLRMAPIRAPTLLALLALLWTGTALAVEFGAGDARMRVYWWKGTLVVGVYPLPQEGYIQIARRVMEQPDRYADIAAMNDNRPVQEGRQINFPLHTLKLALRGDALRAMYPNDELAERGWAHTVSDPLETLIALTEAYTGSRGRFKQLAAYNRIRDADRLKRGQEIVIPLEWIPDELGFRPLAVKPPLKLERDPATGEAYVTYALRPDETLYSLLIRFTDRERAEEIQRMADIMLKLNRISSMTRVPSGKPLRIPLEWISEDYLVQKARPQPAPPPAAVPPRRPRFYEPIHVVVDPGHGGIDTGAVYGSRRTGDRVYEHDVVYDIALRLQALLRAKGYQVYPTVQNPQQPTPVEKLPIPTRRVAEVLVTPHYPIQRASVGVNMRVYLIDSIYQGLLRRGVPPENVLLVSIHGDALAPTLRGAMVYYPDYRLRGHEFRPQGRVYRVRQEAIPAAIRFQPQEMEDAHAQSRQLAEDMLAGLRGLNVVTSSRKPLRSYYYRDGERTLPAVLRFSRIPQSVLVEVANLNNREDRQAILRAANRQRIAQGLADAVDRYRNRQAALALSRRAG